jgi:heptosyltransferase II
MSPKNIIVRMPNWIGDLVMATPILADLKNKFPDSSLTVLAYENLCDLLKKDKNIDKLYCLKKQKSIFFKKENKKIISELKNKSFDYGLLLTNSFSSAFLFYKAKINNSIGYKKDFRSFFLKYPINLIKENLHQTIKYKNLLKPLGVEISDTKPKLFIHPEDIKNAKILLYQKGYSDDQILIGINPFAKYGLAKCWPSDRFKQVAQVLAENKKNCIALMGDSESKIFINKIRQNLPKNVINIAGCTTLLQLACLIKSCKLFITNDSGPMHIASALNTPLIALFGSSSDIITGPYNPEDIVINKKVSCSPCFKRKCPLDFKCMNQISTSEVINKINDFFNENT